MTFSEFAKMMHCYIFTEMNNLDFIVALVDLIMEDPYTEADIEDYKNDMYNPMFKGRKTKNGFSEYTALEKIYRGTYEIPKKRIHKILSHINEEKFSEYVDSFLSKSATLELNDILKNTYSEYDADLTVGDNCASLFKSILKSILEDRNKKKSNFFSSNEVNEIAKSDLANNLDIQSCESSSKNNSPELRFSVPAQFEICFCCKYWSGNRPEYLAPDISIKGKCMEEYNSEVKPYTCKDSCKNFFPDYGAIAQYNCQNFIKSKGSSDMLKFFKK